MQDGTTNEEMPVGGVGPRRPRGAKREHVSDGPASHPDAQPRREAALRAGGGAEAQTDMGWTPREWERVFDAADDAIFLTDREFRIARANRAMSQLLGKPLDEILGKTCSQAIHGTDQPLKVCPLAQAHHTKSHAQGEIHLRERDVWLNVSVDPVLDEKGDVAAVLHIIRDVTERKKMKQAMRESEEKYKNLFENAREAIILTDLNGTITGVNQMVADYGFKREELVGQRLFDFVVENHRARAMADFRVLLGGKPVKGEMEVVTPKGVVSVEYKDNPIGRGGRIVGVQAILTDVTKRKRAEQLLREERDTAQRYLDIAGVMLVVIDTEERVGLINRKGCEILGCTEEDVLGKNWFDNFLPPRVRERTRAIFDGLMAGQADENEYAEEAVLTQDGRERIMGWHNTLLKDETGRLIATLSSGEDITDRRRAEEAYRSLVDHSLQGLVLFQEGKAVFANQAMAEITGYAIDEMLALSAEQVRDFVHPEDREIVWQNHRRRLAGEPVPEHYEMRGIRKDGLVCRLDIHASRIDYRGQPAVQAAYIDITERKRAEDALRDSEDKFKYVFDYSVVGKSISLPGGKVQANEAFWQMLGYSQEGLANRTWQEVTHPDDMEASQRVIDSLLSGKREAARFTKRYLHRNGSVVWADVSTSLRHDKEGKPLYFVTTVIDITERKRFEEALEQSERLYRSLFENMMNGFAYCRMLFDQGRPLDFIYLSVNKAFEAQTGLKNVVGKKVSEVIPGIRESDPELLEIYGRVALTGESEAFETYVGVMKMWFSISVYSPQKEYFVAVFDVITERKRAEEALKAERQRLHDVLEAIPIMVCLLTPDYHIAFANHAFREKFGESHGRRCYEYCFGKKEPCDFCETYRVLKTAKPHHWQVTTPDGASVIEVYDFPFTDADGSPMILEMEIDITERKRAEQQLLDYHNRLREIAAEMMLTEERQRRRIAVGVHDQIGQRLALIKLTLQLLGASPVEASTARTLEGVCKEIDQVLEDAHSLTFELSNPILHEVGFEAAVESWLAEQVQDRYGIQCTFEADEPAVRFDKDTDIALFQIVREFLANVIKHAKATHVDVRIHRVGDRAQITVRDDGIGFELSETRFDPKSGGYGLFSTREKLEYLGGELKIESAPGRGTCISIDVPVQSRRKPRTTETSP